MLKKALQILENTHVHIKIKLYNFKIYIKRLYLTDFYNIALV